MITTSTQLHLFQKKIIYFFQGFEHMHIFYPSVHLRELMTPYMITAVKNPGNEFKHLKYEVKSWK